PPWRLRCNGRTWARPSAATSSHCTFSRDFSSRVWTGGGRYFGGAEWAAEKGVGLSCPVRAQVSSRGQRPRKASRTVLDPGGVARLQAGGARFRGNTPRIRPFQGRARLGVLFPGALPPAT